MNPATILTDLLRCIRQIGLIIYYNYNHILINVTFDDRQLVKQNAMKQQTVTQQKRQTATHSTCGVTSQIMQVRSRDPDMRR